MNPLSPLLRMKALLDTGVWFRRYHRLPQKPALRKFLEEEVSEYYLSPLSIAEITYKWNKGKLKGVPNPDIWVGDSIQNFILANPSPAASLKAGMWDWDHGDLVDRLLAAIAEEENLTLVHTDTVLKNFTGFPQKYFNNKG
jgi:PIN domain nuclease of toxin-antitoxin system